MKTKTFLHSSFKQEELRFDATFNHEYIKILDPLEADESCRQLQNMNEQADVSSLVATLRSLLPSESWWTDHPPIDDLAAMRDLGLFLGSIKRHGVEPVEALPEIEPLLLKLGKRTHMIPRDTIHHYISWNPEGKRERRYTNNPQESLLMKSVRISLRNLRIAIEICKNLSEIELSEPQFANELNKLTACLEYMEIGMDNAIKNVTPKFFAQIMRPYFEEVYVAGIAYLGPAAAHVPLSLIDLFLWASDYGDPTYESFWRESSQYSLPPWLQLYEIWYQRPSLVTQLSQALDSAPNSSYISLLHPSFESLQRALKALVIFRGMHFRMAKQAYHEDVRIYDRGSGGGTLELLDNILSITQKNAVFMRKSVTQSANLKPVAESRYGWNGRNRDFTPMEIMD